MVVAVEQHHAGEVYQGFVQAGDGLQVQVVGGLVQNQAIGAAEHQLGEHTAHLLPSGKHLHWLQ